MLRFVARVLIARQHDFCQTAVEAAIGAEIEITGLRTPETEETQQAARVAISELANALKEGFAGTTLWKAAFGATETWIKLLD